jgi:hypothetical protein
MLKIPNLTDVAPPLAVQSWTAPTPMPTAPITPMPTAPAPASAAAAPVSTATVKTPSSAALAGAEIPQSARKKHWQAYSHSDAESLPWERQKRKSGSDGKRGMVGFLIGGAVLFSVMVALVLYVLLKPARITPVITSSAVQAPLPPVTERKKVQKVLPSNWSEADILVEGGPVAEKFLNATSVDEMLECVRDPETVEPLMRARYPDGKVEPFGLKDFSSATVVAFRNGAASLMVQTREFDSKLVNFVNTPAGIRIDWESFVGWSEMPWNEFVETQPTEPKKLRLLALPTPYYNFDFKDESKWRSYQLTLQDEMKVIYGYTPIGSEADQKLMANESGLPVAVILELKFPKNRSSKNQVLIENFVSEGWVEGLDDKP